MNSKRFIVGSTILTVLLILLFYKIPVIKLSYSDHYFYLKDKTFEIGWIHSVEKEPWFEKYKLRNDDLYLVETRFKTFGAGVPSTGEIIPSNDGYVHMRMNRKMEAIHLIVSENIKTTLYTEHYNIPLYKITEKYGAITIESKKLPLWRLLEVMTNDRIKEAE